MSRKHNFNINYPFFIEYFSNEVNFEFKRDTSRSDHNKNPKKGTLPPNPIRPFRQPYNLIYYLVDGTHFIQLGATNSIVKPKDLVIVPENTPFAILNKSSSQGYQLYFKSDFLIPLANDHLEIVFPFFELDANHIIPVKKQETEIIQRAFDDIIFENKRYSNEKEFLIRNYIYILLLRIREIYQPVPNDSHIKTSRMTQLAHKFKHELDKNVKDIREVNQYAKLLNISPKHLYNVVKSTFGKTPRQMISDVLLTEAKVLLKSSDLSISEIAYKLRFNDPSHFSHFIHIHSGQSPVELRKMI